MTPSPLHDEHVSPAYRSKPDPDEPWRYVCPDCGGQVTGDHNAKLEPYRCVRCKEYHAKDDLEDKKA